MKQVLFAFLCIISFSANAQFLDCADFHGSLIKEVTVIDTAGKSYSGAINSVKRKKSLMQSFSLKTKDDEKIDFEIGQIRIIYAKNTSLARAGGLGGTLQKMGKTKSINKNDTIEFVPVKNIDGDLLLLQVINPDFCSKIKVYGDPAAEKTVSWTGYDGGMEKSYYISKNGEPVSRIFKKEADEKFPQLFDDCASLKGKTRTWENLDKYVKEYDTCK